MSVSSPIGSMSRTSPGTPSSPMVTFSERTPMLSVLFPADAGTTSGAMSISKCSDRNLEEPLFSICPETTFIVG